MNLTIDPWIPALRIDGGRHLFSLQALFSKAHEIRDLAVKPHERIAVMRLLVCITQAALDGPSDECEWQDCRALIQSRVPDYLQKWKPAFELFGDGPRFLQFPNLHLAKGSDEGNSATKLDLLLATGNNPTLLDTQGSAKRTINHARSALNLLTFQNFAPCGRIGVALWDNSPTPGGGSSVHAPCTPSSMVHTILVGDTLLETIHLNLITRECAMDAYGQAGWGKPVWELPVETIQDSAAIQNATLSHLGRLVPISRAIRLNEDGRSVILANGLTYLPAFREATATITKQAEELKLLSASTSRSLWRQLSAITVKRHSQRDGTCGPLALSNLMDSTDAIIWVGALIAAGNGKIVQVVESTYSLPAGMLSEFGRAAYETGVSYADQWQKKLDHAVGAYSRILDLASTYRARQYFWTQVEQHLPALFELAHNIDFAADLPNCAWGKAIQASARDAYEQSCPRQTPRQIQAYVVGLEKLNPTKPKRTKPKQS
jgi:CRISPR system Cascade subunit CasA